MLKGNKANKIGAETERIIFEQCVAQGHYAERQKKHGITIYGTQRHIDIVLNESIVIEVQAQNVSGTGDQKLVYKIHDAVELLTTSSYLEYILVLKGKQLEILVPYLKTILEKIKNSDKVKIRILTFNEFCNWVKFKPSDDYQKLWFG